MRIYDALYGFLCKVWIVVACVLYLTACNSMSSMTPEEKSHIDTLTRDMITRCFGRYVIDLPAAFTAGYQDSHTLPPGVKDISIKRMSKPEFDLDIEAYEKRIAAMRIDGEPDNPYFKGIEHTPHLQNGKVFNRARTGMTDVRRSLDLWAWKDGYRLIMSIDANDGRAERYKDRSDRYRRYNTPQKLQQLLELYSRTRGRADDEIPTEAGFCIRNGFVAGKVTDDAQESIHIKYNLTGTPDVYVMLETTSEFAEEDTLLERMRTNSARFSEEGIKHLRKGTVKGKTGLAGEEVLAEGPKDTEDADGNPVIGHGFYYEAHSKTGTATQPIITVSLRTGMPQMHPKKPKKDLYDTSGDTKIEKAGLSRAEAVALWDAIIRTIRPRPGAF